MKTASKLALLLALVALPGGALLPGAHALACGSVRSCAPITAQACPSRHLLAENEEDAQDAPLTEACRAILDYEIGDGPGNVTSPPTTDPQYYAQGCGIEPDHAYLVLSGDGDGTSFRFAVKVMVCHQRGDRVVGDPRITTSDGYRPTWAKTDTDVYYVYNQDHQERDITFCVTMKRGETPCRTWHQWN